MVPITPVSLCRRWAVITLVTETGDTETPRPQPHRISMAKLRVDKPLETGSMAVIKIVPLAMGWIPKTDVKINNNKTIK